MADEAAGNEALFTLSDYPFDPFEIGMLTAARHFLNSFEDPQSQSWHLAYSVAVERGGVVRRRLANARCCTWSGTPSARCLPDVAGLTIQCGSAKQAGYDRPQSSP